MSNDLTPPPKDLLDIRGRYYFHYKGGLYKVLAVVRNSETKAFEVVYESIDRPDELPWVRPATDGAAFLGMVEVRENGIMMGRSPRFVRRSWAIDEHPVELIIINPLRNK